MCVHVCQGAGERREGEKREKERKDGHRAETFNKSGAIRRKHMCRRKDKHVTGVRENNKGCKRQKEKQVE